MRQSPILSIVIPTKNRYQYLEPLLNTLISFESDEFEVIIHDNTTDNSPFLGYLGTLNDNRISYYHNSKSLSVCDNCDLAIAFSSGTYVCMIGDDDGILPTIIPFCHWLNRENIDAVKVNKIHYVWSDLEHRYWGEGYSGRINIPKYKYKIDNLDIKFERNQILNKGGVSIGNLPCVYHGIISRKALLALRKDTKTFFPGPSPDMANAMAVSFYCKKAIYADFPLVITGNSVKSTAGDGAKGKHHGELSKKSFLPIDTIDKWSDYIPFFWSGPTIWAESTNRALSSLKIDGRKRMNLSYLYASCLVFHFRYSNRVFKAIFNNHSLFGKCIVTIKTLLFTINILYKRSILFIKNVYKNKYGSKETLVIKDIKTIEGAINYFNGYYSDLYAKIEKL